jgi:hypothetical protein
LVLLSKLDMPLDAPIPDIAATDAHHLHRRLATFNHWRSSPSSETVDWLASLQAEYRLRRIEHDFIEEETTALRSQAREAPSDPDRFVEWFERLEQLGPGREARLFPFLAEQASLDQMLWFLRQDVVTDAGLSELSLLTQLRFSPSFKSDKCRMGCYEPDPAAGSSARGLLLDRLGQTLALAQQASDPVWESLALSNVMVALAANRRYAYHSAGALAAREATMRDRRRHVRRGVDRLGIQHESDRNCAHDTALLAWSGETLHALVANEPAAASSIAEGALLRLTAEARCFERYRSELQQLQLYTSSPPPLMESLPPAPALHA